MCGRYARRSDKQRIAEAMSAGVPAFEIGATFNAAPQSFQPVVRSKRETGEREIVLMRWGLVPYWSKDQKIAYSTINAKAETIATSPAFREALRYRRCLVPADAFYEWQKLDAKTKQPYAIALKSGEIYAFAGLWERWKDEKTQAPLETFTIITTDPNELVEPLHNRMPVIIPRRDYERWLAPCEPDRLPIDLLRPYPVEEMTAWKVIAAVGNVRNDRPELIEPARQADLGHL